VTRTLFADAETPVGVYRKLAAGRPGTFLLESAEQGRVGRYSFIGVRPRRTLRWSLGDPGDPYAMAAAELARYSSARLPGLPPFAGGAVGMFAYDLVRTVDEGDFAMTESLMNILKLEGIRLASLTVHIAPYRRSSFSSISLAIEN